MNASPQLKAQLEDPRRRKYLNFEREIYLHKFQQDEVASNDLVIGPEDFLHFSFIRRVPETPDNVLVILHGYGGFGGVFYRLVEALAHHFFIVLVDLPDMGFSSRKNRQIFTDTDNTIEYFVSRIVKFVQGMGFQRFSLMGHSIGAFIAAHTFDRIEGIERLYLLSPAGFNPVGDPSFTQRKEEFMANLGFFKRFLIRTVENKLYKDKQSPFEMFCVPMQAKKWVIQKYWNSPRFRMTELESRLFYEIHAYFLSLPQFGERCLGYFLHYGINSPRPIIDVLLRQREKIDRVSLFFGDNDWMDREASQMRLQENKLEVPFFVVPNSEHQLIFQNPTHIAENVLGIHPEWVRKNSLPQVDK